MVDVHQPIIIYIKFGNLHRIPSFFGDFRSFFFFIGEANNVIIFIIYDEKLNIFYTLTIIQNMEADTPKTISIFMMNGINSLLGWNAVLAALDYFQAAFSSYNIYAYLPIPLFIGYIIVGSIYHNLSNRFTYATLIVTGNTIMNISLMSILTVSIVFKQSMIGFILLLCCSLLLGIGTNLGQLSFLAMINYLSQGVVSKYTVGTAICGLLITIVRMVMLAIFGPDNTLILPIIIYFAVAITINTFDLFINIAFGKSTVYKVKIQRFLNNQNNVKNKIDQALIAGTTEQYTNIDNVNRSLAKTADEGPTSEQKKIQSQNYFKTLYETGKLIYPYPWIIMISFAITFTLFPAPSFSITIDSFPQSWTVILIVLFFSIGDTFGKYVAQFDRIFNKRSLMFIFFARILFFFPMSIMAMGADKDDDSMHNFFFPFFNQFLFSATNGFCMSASFIMSFQVCPQAYKKYAGVLNGLMLQVGIILGTIVEVPYGYLLGIN